MGRAHEERLGALGFQLWHCCLLTVPNQSNRAATSDGGHESHPATLLGLGQERSRGQNDDVEALSSLESECRVEALFYASRLGARCCLMTGVSPRRVPSQLFLRSFGAMDFLVVFIMSCQPSIGGTLFGMQAAPRPRAHPAAPASQSPSGPCRPALGKSRPRLALAEGRGSVATCASNV